MQREMPRALLALDLGTRTGWAFSPASGIILSGSWDLSPGRGDEALRYQLLRNTLDVFWFQHGDENFEVLYEQVHRHAGTQAAHVYGGLRSVVLVWCLEHGIKAQPVGVGQIKKFWTGNGQATKEWMIQEACARGFDPLDDNEADALALLHRRIIEGPGGEKEKPRKTRRQRTAPEIARRSVARRTARGLREGDGEVPEGGGEHPKTDREPFAA